MTLDDVEARMTESLPRFEGLGATVLYDFGDEGMLYLDATATPPTLSREVGDADCTLTITLDDFVKMTGGELDPMMAFTLGKLKITGNMGIAMKLQGLLED